ncbi:thiamine-phosphate kinase [Cohaesibacter intestini]|uniref:thiamine-phosphate kinase n=1 Tax=Cohaesibacter intestini TaxID=2211145 RepID=UPI000DE8FEAE|nr:thiamine-phosphate kinase [Cohaesibacter intestini]
MSDQKRRIGESAMIARYFAPLCKEDAAYGLSDDAAFLSVPDGQQLVLTKDMLVADVHFFAKDRPDLIAAKALRVNLSDLAAKGAKPYGYMLGLGLPLDWTEDWLEQFCVGLARDQKLFDFPLLGGDTVKSPERLTLSITAFGLLDHHRQVLRKNAAPGDLVYVSGTIGDGALGLQVCKGELADILTQEQHAFLADRFLLPQPRVALREMIARLATASMDISDGLLGDATKMAQAAKVAITISQENVPISDAARAVVTQMPDMWQSVLGGGDDYELLFTIPPKHRIEAESVAKACGVPIAHVGSVGEGNDVHLRDKQGALQSIGNMTAYEHF